MDKPCIIPWQSLMIRADGSIRPCCNSHRTLNSYANFDGDNIWNTDESVNLRRETLTGKLDNFCTVCRSRNVDPPEEIISKIYTEHAIFCENLPEANGPVAIAGPSNFGALHPWQGAYVNFANGRAPGLSDRLALDIRHDAAADTPDLYFLRSHDNTILASARGIPVDECNIEIFFENKALQFDSADKLFVVAEFAGGEYREIAWKIDEEIAMTDRILYVGDQKYPIISDVIAPLGIMGYFDECFFIGNVLRCKGWAFDRNRDRVPDRFAIFSRNQFIAISGPRGERYDVAKAMSSSKAVKSGFFFTVELGDNFDIREYIEIQVVALFAESHYAHLVGTARAN
jgi:Iron-sulfur cluster-binding domain